MTQQGHLSRDLQAILDEFAKLRDSYAGLKSYCEAQEELLRIERAETERAKENAEKVMGAYSEMKKRYVASQEEAERQRKELQRELQELRRKECENLRLVDQNNNENEVCRLRDEVEVLRAQLAAQEERHREETELQGKRHCGEIMKYKRMLEKATPRAKARNAGRGRGKSTAKHPAVDNARDANKRGTAQFRWPSLDVTVTNDDSDDSAEIPEKMRKIEKRKLFHEDQDAVIDIP